MAERPGKRRKPPVAKPLGGQQPVEKPPVRRKAVPPVDVPPVVRTETFDFAALSRSDSRPTARRRKPAWQSPPVVAGSLLAICVVLGLGAVWLLGDRGDSPAARPIARKQVDDIRSSKPTPPVDVPQTPSKQPEDTPRATPEEPRLDPQTGESSRQPAEQPEEQPDEPAQGPVERLAAGLRERGLSVELGDSPISQPLAGQSTTLIVEGQQLAAIPYRAAAEADNAAAAISLIEMLEYGTNEHGQPMARLFKSGPLIVFYAGGNTSMLVHLTAELGEPIRVGQTDAGPPPLRPIDRPDVPSAVTDDVPAAVEDDDASLLELHKQGKLFVRKQYPALRKIFADRFQRWHQNEIEQAYGPDHEEMAQWLDEHPEIKEEFYTAIDPGHDNVSAALGLFKELKDRFPKETPLYWNLAIATAVTWDQQRGGVYDYVGHQRRTKSKLPEARLAALENFEYMITGEKFMQMRAQFLPWEFLVHVVNHRTPLVERRWARANYLPRIVLYGKCYKDVPYDNEMLNSKSEVARLNGKDYTLANLRQFGGVCSMQADFAARVGKSMAVPAAYVAGESAFGGSHAWVMWIELQGVTKSNIAFELKSEGRYRGDKFYVGTLTDPQTARKITDRQLELRLQTVGQGPQNRRHAALIMKAFAVLGEKTEMDVPGRLMFLYKVIDLCPGNEAAWTAMAAMSREGIVTQKHNKAMMTALEKLFATFARFPDFTWEIFDDLVAFQEVPKQRAKLFERLVALYETADRPDLACKARLKYTDYLVEDKQHQQAIQGLATSIMKFPREGRYVPRMLDRLEEICAEVPRTESRLVEFYRQFLPQVPQMRGKEPSPYCIKTYQRAIEFFQKSGQLDAVQYYQGQLARLKALQG